MNTFSAPASGATVPLSPGASPAAAAVDRVVPDDSSAIAWVHDELRRSLDAAHKLLRRFLRESESHAGSDVAARELGGVRQARSLIHQSAGAMTVVGSSAAARVLDASDAALRWALERPTRIDAALVEKIEQASFAVVDWLGRQKSGKGVSSLYLFPQMQALLEVAGADRVHPADLWDRPWQFCSLTIEPAVMPRPVDARSLTALEQLTLANIKTPSPLILARISDFFAGLALVADDSTQNLRALWQLAAAVFEALAQGLLLPDVFNKRLGSKLLSMLRSLQRGQPLDQSAISRLGHDLLFSCSQSRSDEAARPAPRLSAARAAYGLQADAAINFADSPLGRFDPALVVQARKRVHGAKLVWSSVAAGEAHHLAAMVETFSLVGDSLRRLFPDGAALADQLESVAAHGMPAGQAPDAGVAMEVATALLYVEAALEETDFATPSPNRPIARLAERLTAVRTNGSMQPLESWIEDLYGRVADRQTLGTVVQELRTTMAAAEQQLDKFFRAPDDHGVLEPVPPMLQSMSGVLSVLGVDQAARTLRQMHSEIEPFAAGRATAPMPQLLERLAANVSALGFLIDMYGVQPALAKSMFRFDSASARLVSTLSREPAAKPVDTPADVGAIAAAPDPAIEWPAVQQQPGNEAGVDGLPQRQAETADPALLAIFCEEAKELLESVRSGLNQWQAGGDPAESLETLRRNFHTLKGSARMVGCDAIGELGWQAEQRYNTRMAVDPEPQQIEAAEPDSAADRQLREWTWSIADRISTSLRVIAATVENAADADADADADAGLEAEAEAEAGAEAEAEAGSATETGRFEATAPMADFSPDPDPGDKLDLDITIPGELDFDLSWLEPARVSAAQTGLQPHPEAELEPKPAQAPESGSGLEFESDPDPESESESESEFEPDFLESTVAGADASAAPSSVESEPLQPLGLPADLPTAADLELDFGIDTPRAQPAAEQWGSSLRPPAGTPELPKVSSEVGVEDIGRMFNPAQPPAEDLSFIRLDLSDPLPLSEPHSEPPEEPRQQDDVAAPAAQDWQPADVELPAQEDGTDTNTDTAAQSPAEEDLAVRELDLGDDPGLLELFDRPDDYGQSAVPAEPSAAEDATNEWVDVAPASDSPGQSDADLTAFEVPGRESDSDLPAAGPQTGFDADPAQFGPDPSLSRVPTASQPDQDWIDVSRPAELEPTQWDQGASASGSDSGSLETPPPVDAAEQWSDTPSLPMVQPPASEPAASWSDVEPDPGSFDQPFAPAPLPEPGWHDEPAETLQFEPGPDMFETVQDSVPPPDAAFDAAAHDASVGHFVDFPFDAGAGSDSPSASAPPFTENAAPINEIAAEPAQAETVQFKQVGFLQVPMALFNIFLNEADELSRQLCTELAEWAMQRQTPISDAPIERCHALTGNSSAVGFVALSDLTRELEEALSREQQIGLAGGSCAEDDARLFSDAAEEARQLLHQFAAGFLYLPSVALQQRLSNHREESIRRLQAVQATFTPIAEPVPQPASAQPDDWLADIQADDQVDADLFPIFEEEAQDLLPQLASALRDWARQPEQTAPAGAAMRHLHTFKGGARLAGAMRLGEIAHRLETRIEQIAADEAPVQRSAIDTLMSGGDVLQHAFEALRESDARAYAAADARVFASLGTVAETAANSAADLVPPPQAEMAAPTEQQTAPQSDTSNIDWSRFDQPARPAPSTGTRGVGASSQASVKIRASLLERMVNQAGEVNMSRARIEVEMGQVRSAMAELGNNIDRLRQQLHDIEIQAETQISSRSESMRASAQPFDPLEIDRYTRLQELSRMMAESVNDVATVQRALKRSTQRTEDELAAQTRLTRDLQSDLLRTRMVEFDTLADRLHRVVRQTANGVAKQVELQIFDGNIELDRSVLDRLTPVFEHLLRNAVIHGIESADARLQCGKAATGTLQIRLHQHGNEVAIDVIDDGAGLDLMRIRQRAEVMGMSLAEGQEADVIFTPGFSTADRLTEMAGRGVGLDVVRNQLSAIDGQIEVTSSVGQGCHFSMTLPLTTAMTQVLMLRCGELTIAVPATMVERVRRTSEDELATAQASGQYLYGESSLQLFWLGALLGHSQGSGEPFGRSRPVVVVHSGKQRLALLVDEVLGQQEAVVKHLGAQLSRVPGLAGMSMLASGSVALIYNPLVLASEYGATARDPNGPLQPSPLQGLVARSSLVLVVDDSLTVRRVTQRLLLREGYRVELAKDGIEALERISNEMPRVVLSDIEMPRMDGYELVGRLREAPETRTLPVVMITSRIADKHRVHAESLGVARYLGKPYAEEELLSAVDECLQQQAARE